MLVTGIRLENVRVFEGEHFIPIDPRLTVLIGRNNAGKSTVLRAPFSLRRQPHHFDVEAYRRHGTAMTVAVQFQVTPVECANYFEIDPDQIRFAGLRRGGQPAGSLAKHPSFGGWSGAPHIESGHHWPAEGGSTNIVRLVARVAANYLEVWADRSVRARVDGTAYQVTIPADPFAKALGRAVAEDVSVASGPLIAHWEHHCVPLVTEWLGAPGRRIRDSDESRLQEALTFLRMKHSIQFDQVSRALKRAFPEFGGLDFIETQPTGFSYRPSFVTATGAGRALTRESVGSGAWAYLCILTAARAAKATGARILFLDEPHLYMHPGLERLLIDELLDGELWDGVPMQIVAATHSPVFVNAAIERGTLNVMDWKDESRKSAKVETIRCDDPNARRLGDLVSDPGDILYADRIVFVEGPSDIAALRILARERCKLKCSIRYVPLRETDTLAPDIAKFFSIVVQAGGAGAHTRALLLLDGDKRAQLEKKWDKAGADDPRKTSGLAVLWSNPLGNDLESVFCDEAFLVAYFANRGVPEATSRPAVKGAIAKLVFPAAAKAAKGCVAIRSLHEDLLGEVDGGLTKADDLEALMRFYLGAIGSVIAKDVAAAVKPLEEALFSLGHAEASAKPA